MKRRKFPWRLFAMLLLMIAAFASAALAMKPLIYNAEKTREIKRENKQFYVNAEIVQGMVEEAEAAEEPIPFEQLYEAIQRYNGWLVDIRQGNLTNRAATEVTPFSLVQYGLPDEVFGVIRIPAMDVEMPIYLGASEENMANGAAVLSKTSIPIGGENTNAVIAGHRGWNGYPYFMDIEKLQKGDTVTITNLWGELTYKVTEIRIVYPDDIEAILIQEGKDMITLMTCHPPNSGGKYRYLVFCERTESPGGDASVFIP